MERAESKIFLNVVWIFVSFYLFTLSSCMHSRGTYYRVKKGDTIYRISKLYEVDVESLMRLNELSKPQDLKEGGLIYVPSTKEIPESVIKTSPRSKSKRHRVARYRRGKLLKNFDFSWPLKGRILTGFGRGEKHRYDGINIESQWGREVRAASEGKVVYSGNGVKGYGNMVIVKHRERVYSIYALNSENLVSKGDYVRKAQVIAKVGGIPKIGKSFLHFQIRRGKKAINPLSVLR